jgi:hypothetical protein
MESGETACEHTGDVVGRLDQSSGSGLNDEEKMF